MKNGHAQHVLIAGGAGFIGSHLCEAYLAEGAHVCCVDSLRTGSQLNLKSFLRDPRFTLIEADVSLPFPKSLTSTRQSFDLIINAACAASPPHYQADPQHTMLTCVVGTHALLGLAEQNRAKFLMCSTSEVYGDPLVHPQIESYWGNVNPTGPRACYDEGKRAAETLCFDSLRQKRVDVRVSRIFNTYGPRMQVSDGRVVSNIICQALADDDITIYGDGEQTRSFCYVSDMVGGLMRLGAHEGQVATAVNLGNPSEITVNELLTLILDMIDTQSAVVRRPLPVDDPQRRRPDIAKAERMLGWRPTVDLHAGLTRTVDDFLCRVAPAARSAGERTRAVAAS